MTGRGPGRRVIAVVPLYRPAPSAHDGIRVAAEQVDAVVLVDDGSGQDLRPFVDGLGLPDVRLLVLSQNFGIAHALNRGVAMALDELNADHILTLDQDSVLEPDYVDRALAASLELELAGVPFAAVAAGTVDGKPNRGDHLEGLPFRLTRETIQSGMLLPRAVLETLGPFDESFFIDCVDTDYILRGWAHGLPTVLAPDCRMQHAMGDGIRVHIPVLSRRREYVVPYHRPARRYYITRNRLRLLARHGRSSPGWAARQTYEQAKYWAMDLVWGPEKGRQLVATGVGLWHGATGRGGRVPTHMSALLARPSGHDRRPTSSTSY